MKTLFTLLLLFFACATVFSQEPQFPFFKNADSLLIRSGVNSEKTYLSSDKNNDSIITAAWRYNRRAQYVAYNIYQKGKLIQSQQAEYSNDGHFQTTHTDRFVKKATEKTFAETIYDSSGRRIKTTVTDLQTNEMTIYEEAYFGDSLAETKITLPQHYTFVASREYFAGKKLIREDRYSSAGFSSYEYVYNSDSSEVTISLLFNGKRYFKEKDSYDAQGRLVQVMQAIAIKNGGITNEKWNKNNPPVIFHYFYNSDGSLAQRNYTDKNGVVWIEKRYYSK